jgi:hypothetical protein
MPRMHLESATIGGGHQPSSFSIIIIFPTASICANNVQGGNDHHEGGTSTAVLAVALFLLERDDVFSRIAECMCGTGITCDLCISSSNWTNVSISAPLSNSSVSVLLRKYFFHFSEASKTGIKFFDAYSAHPTPAWPSKTA